MSLAKVQTPCCVCACPVDANAIHGAQLCQNPSVLLCVHNTGAPRVQCCRCACRPGDQFCLYCIDQLRKRKAADSSMKADQELDAECKKQWADRAELEALQKRVKDLDEQPEKHTSDLRKLKAQVAEMEEVIKRRQQRIHELESKKRRRLVDERQLDATRSLVDGKTFRTPSRQTSGPIAQSVAGDTDAEPSTESQTTEAASSTAQGQAQSSQLRAGVRAVVAHMEANMSSAKAQEKGCASLKKMAGAFDADGDLAKAAVRATIAAEGGISKVIQAMNEHRGSAGVQEQGCSALLHLALHSDENREKIEAEGGVASAVAGMQKHADSAAVQQAVCMLLFRLACNSHSHPRDDDPAWLCRAGAGGCVRGAQHACRGAPKRAQDWPVKVVDPFTGARRGDLGGVEPALGLLRALS
eukprot:3756432-Rhodomonas_salina.1